MDESVKQIGRQQEADGETNQRFDHDRLRKRLETFAGDGVERHQREKDETAAEIDGVEHVENPLRLIRLCAPRRKVSIPLRSARYKDFIRIVGAKRAASASNCKLQNSLYLASVVKSASRGWAPSGACLSKERIRMGGRTRMRCSRWPSGASADACSSSSARRRASARPTPCLRAPGCLASGGVDVVVGLVETHGRADTLALTRGSKSCRAASSTIRARRLEEFDLDAALKRRPKLIIVDELAHTNAPESRHPKRWQDVEELLDARIDVWTALNVQHIESLADVVSRVTGVVVRETVPDTVLRDADDIILVDLTAEELIQRLKDGKVYLPQTAELAQEKFFTLRNLTALRELALRRTAARVDDQMVEQLRQNAIEGPWETSERLLVCVGPDPRSMDVVRAASRLATGLNASWVAASVESPTASATLTGVGAVDAALNLARSLGADTERLSGRDLPAEILAYAQRENITQIVIGRSRASWLRRLFGRSLSDALVRRAELVGVHVVTGDPKKGEALKPQGRSAPSATKFDRQLGSGSRRPHCRWRAQSGSAKR